MVNKRKSYVFVNKETGKIVKYNRVLQYFRTKSTAMQEIAEVKNEMAIDIKIKDLRPPRLKEEDVKKMRNIINKTKDF